MPAIPGLRYCSQSVSMLVNLSSPATMGTMPKENLRMLNVELIDIARLRFSIFKCLIIGLTHHLSKYIPKRLQSRESEMKHLYIESENGMTYTQTCIEIIIPSTCLKGRHSACSMS